MVNIRTKGASGEREICDAINEIYDELEKELNITIDSILRAQRNQIQTAVGGDDVTNTCGMSIEVKRQEKLAINTWWKQCMESSRRSGKIPVLLYRQSRKAWSCITFAEPYRRYSQEKQLFVRVEMSFDDFKKWFKEHARVYITMNGNPK
ncbi:hypothetical protein QJS83_14845 [Bdellovibrio sp. 22V]|uniref:putative PDDEXK endonuclease n=1 Tax=Bdellovibrio sp. 22V TaxID=3044166 RepID=UPI002542F663|nr:hypothetical protein [Bdellovibrio sp. 22V]WII71741.1 hypothetical protein QJS83_14845 [Bdellovibrio sp. 22V]